MDRFAEGMTARGPTLGRDRSAWTGSLHIVDLPSAQAAVDFVEHEPYNRAGLFERHLVRRFKNVLGRTMWEFPEVSLEPRFLIIAQLRAGERNSAPAAPPSGLPAVAQDRLIVHGELLTPEEELPAGVALALQAPSRDAVDGLLEGARPIIAQDFDVEILDWEFGGRR